MINKFLYKASLRVSKEIIKLRGGVYFIVMRKCSLLNLKYSEVPTTCQMVKLAGKGSISFGNGVQLGVMPSPQLKFSEVYIEARGCDSEIIIGDNVYVNNGASIIADKSKITIGSNSIIGPNFTCFDSNFHPLNPRKRLSNDYHSKPVMIGSNVFIGANVTILKGCIIGDDSVIGAGSTIVSDVPKQTVVSQGNQLNYQTLHIEELL